MISSLSVAVLSEAEISFCFFQAVLFSEVTKRVDQYGCAVILKNNQPRYLVLDFGSVDFEGNIDDESLLAVAHEHMKKDVPVYKSLAK